MAASHGEGKFVAGAELAAQLRKNGQIAFQYADAEGNATMDSPANPNGSTEAIEGIISPDGLILGIVVAHDLVERLVAFGGEDKFVFVFPVIILPFFMLTLFLVQMIGAEVN